MQKRKVRLFFIGISWILPNFAATDIFTHINNYLKFRK